jgi:hypothetical protein
LESIACQWPVSVGFPLKAILRQFGDLNKTENGSCWPTSTDLYDAAPSSQRVFQQQKMMSAMTAAFLRIGRRMRATFAAADHCQPGLLLVAELAQIADAGNDYFGICNGPQAAVNHPFRSHGNLV